MHIVVLVYSTVFLGISFYFMFCKQPKFIKRKVAEDYDGNKTVIKQVREIITGKKYKGRKTLTHTAKLKLAEEEWGSILR